MSVITLGACGEIGRFIAYDLVKSGFKVTLADIREFEGNHLARKLGTRASFLKLDIRDFETGMLLLEKQLQKRHFREYLQVFHRQNPIYETIPIVHHIASFPNWH